MKCETKVVGVISKRKRVLKDYHGAWILRVDDFAFVPTSINDPR